MSNAFRRSRIMNKYILEQWDQREFPGDHLMNIRIGSGFRSFC